MLEFTIGQNKSLKTTNNARDLGRVFKLGKIQSHRKKPEHYLNTDVPGSQRVGAGHGQSHSSHKPGIDRCKTATKLRNLLGDAKF